MIKRKAFTMIELVFVIVIMGIIGKFGVEFLAQAYKSFIYSSINNQLQAQSETAVEFISKRLENRIRDSVIVRDATNPNVPIGLDSALNNGTNYDVLEWVGSDEDGFRGLTTSPTWSGILDLNAGILAGNLAGIQNLLVSPETNTTSINTMIQALSYQHSTISDAALYFIGSDNDVLTGYGWNGAALANQSFVMHPIQSVAGQPTQFLSNILGASFAGVNVSEYFKLAWTAYAIVYEPGTDDKGTLRLYWNYQPWLGDRFSDNNPNIQNAVIMRNVSTFKFIAVGSLIKIQVCVKSDVVEDYALCKEKTVF